MNSTILKTQIKEGTYDAHLLDVYRDETCLADQKQRYYNAITAFESLYGEGDVTIFSAPGRSEVGGNHTDHQHGSVLAAAINLDAIAIVAKKEHVIDIVSDDLHIPQIDVRDLEKKEEEVSTSQALVRGVCAKIKEHGYICDGFEAYITSDVLMGAGLSSSAAFETLIGTIQSGLYNNMEIDAVLIAKIGQYAENHYFEKPCGLMDQCASSLGSLIQIDFFDIEHPVVKKVEVDFDKFHHSLCIVDTKGSHADLTSDYAAIPIEMKQVAQYFHASYLHEVDEQTFFSHIEELRSFISDRCILRAIHFFHENHRVPQEVQALESNDFTMFKQLVKASGNSSFMFLQNVYTNQDIHHQGVSLGLAMSEHILQDHGVCRVHGGGFAGTMQAFVENDYVDVYKREIEKVFGKGSCHVLKVRMYGGMKVM